MDSQSKQSTSRKGVETLTRTSSAVSRPLISVSLHDARIASGKKNSAADLGTAPLLEKVNLINESQVQYRYVIKC